jgi:hypothetical protein
MLSCDGMTIYGRRTGYWYTLIHNSWLHFTISITSILVFCHELLRSSCNGFQRRMFLFLWVPELTPYLIKSNSRLPTVSILSWTLDSSRLSTATATLIIAAAAPYIAYALTAQKTPLLTVFYCCLLMLLAMAVASLFLSRSRLSNRCICHNTIGWWMK